MGAFSFLSHHVRAFEGIVVHETQSILNRADAFYRGGPEWPHFHAQVFARHCWGAIPRPNDSRPRPATTTIERAATGVWCGAAGNHFGHFVADFGMRLAASSRLDETTPLLFSVQIGEGTTPFFWQIIDHLGVDPRRIMLIDRPTRFERLRVLPQAERRFGGGPSRRHLRMMDELTAPAGAVDRDLAHVFVSRGRWPHGRFAGESYLDEALAAAGVAVLHPETVDLQAQIAFYRRARSLIFSEGSAVHALQLIGHIDADIAVLARRRFSHIAAASLRPRGRSLRYLRVVKGLIYGLNPSGQPHRAGGISVLDEARLVAAFQRAGVALAPHWDSKAYAARRGADVADWVARREASGWTPGERRLIENALRALSLPML